MSARMKAQINISANKYVNKICICHIPIPHNGLERDNFYYVFFATFIGIQIYSKRNRQAYRSALASDFKQTFDHNSGRARLMVGRSRNGILK